MLRKNVLLVLFSLVFFSFSNTFAQEINSQKKSAMPVVNARALSLPAPAYPAAARAIKVSGSVNVQVLIDKQGTVESAKALSGHPLLRRNAVDAARKALFKPTLISNEPVKVSGIIVYNFVGEQSWKTIGTNLGFAGINGIKSVINLPAGFEEEEKQLRQLKQNTLDTQKAQMPNTVALIKAKLSAKELWLFEYGIARANVFNGFNKKDDSLIISGLEAFKTLEANLPMYIPEKLHIKASNLAKFADKEQLTKEDKQNIWYNLK